MGSKTICKFVCISKTIRGAGENQTNQFEFTPVTGDSPANKEFWKWTPSGKLEFQCLNPQVEFAVGAEYMIEITPA